MHDLLLRPGGLFALFSIQWGRQLPLVLVVCIWAEPDSWGGGESWSTQGSVWDRTWRWGLCWCPVESYSLLAPATCRPISWPGWRLCRPGARFSSSLGLVEAVVQQRLSVAWSAIRARYPPADRWGRVYKQVFVAPKKQSQSSPEWWGVRGTKMRSIWQSVRNRITVGRLCLRSAHAVEMRFTMNFKINNKKALWLIFIYIKYR